tara:strand:+ start:6802 stop:7104 length:303 start_codon:yes stop_codon:yes gene_type:complete
MSSRSNSSNTKEKHHVFHRMRAMVKREANRSYPLDSAIRGELIINPSSVDPSRPFIRNQMSHSNRYIDPEATVVDPSVRLHPGPPVNHVLDFSFSSKMFL